MYRMQTMTTTTGASMATKKTKIPLRGSRGDYYTALRDAVAAKATTAGHSVEKVARRLEAKQGGPAEGAKRAREFATWHAAGSADRRFWLEVARTLESVAE